jgi:hypothetical protein
MSYYIQCHLITLPCARVYHMYHVPCTMYHVPCTPLAFWFFHGLHLALLISTTAGRIFHGLHLALFIITMVATYVGWDILII